jgi:hypothetical protein
MENRGVSAMRFSSETPRSDVDMNRAGGRRTIFRKKLDAEVSSLSCDDILLDIHSAPGDTLEYKFEIYILDMHGVKNDDAFNEALFSHLRKEGVIASMLSGEKRNDITFRAMHDFGLKNVSLIEINETLPPKRVREIAEIITDFVSKWSSC